MIKNISTYDWVLFSIPLVALVVLRMFGFDGNVGQDAYAYTDYTISLQNWFLTGIKPPPFFWPPGYPLIAALMSFNILSASLALQLVSSLSLGILLVYINRALIYLETTGTAYSRFIFLLLFGLGAPYFFRNSMVNTSDMIACLTVAGALYHFFRYQKNQKWTDLLLLTSYISYGITVRYVTFLIFFPIILYTTIIWQQVELKWKQLSVLIIPLITVLIYLLLNESPTRFLSHKTLSNWQFSYFLSNEFDVSDGSTQYAFPNLIFVFYPFFHLGFCLPGLLFVYLLFKNKNWHQPRYLILIAIFCVFSFFMAGVFNQNPRHLLVVYPVVLMLCYHGFHQVFIKYTQQKTLISFLIVCIFIQISLSTRALYPTIQHNKLERAIADDLIKYKDSTELTLYTFGIDVALKYRQNSVQINSLYDSVYVQFQKGALALLNESAWQYQWADKNPMINVLILKTNHTLIKLNEYDAGKWILYKIE